MKSTTDKRVIKTKKAIKTTLIDIMSKKELADITVSELARKADINRKTFYSHYPNVQAVFEEIEDDMISASKNMIIQHKAENNTLPSAAIRAYCKQMTADFAFYHRLSLLNSPTLIEKYKKALIDLVLRDTVKNLKYNEEKKTLIMEFIASGLMSMSTKWFASDMTLTFEEMIAITAEITNNITKCFI